VLAILPEQERAQLAPELVQVDLTFKQVLQEIEQPLEHVWFPSAGVVSMVSEMEDGGIVELATIGREGMVGVSLLLGSDRIAQRLLCQIPGSAARMRASRFVKMIDDLPVLRRILLRYALTLLNQIGQGSACNRLHPIEARCARWLLMTHDRVDTDRFPLTQEFLGQMLGVTRPSVSIAAGMLQKAGLIHYVRGTVTILDRPGLEAAACECYAAISAEFRRLVNEAN
jgi:CRP-like cAMP-binding protein